MKPESSRSFCKFPARLWVEPKRLTPYKCNPWAPQPLERPGSRSDGSILKWWKGMNVTRTTRTWQLPNARLSSESLVKHACPCLKTPKNADNIPGAASCRYRLIRAFIDRYRSALYNYYWCTHSFLGHFFDLHLFICRTRNRGCAQSKSMHYLLKLSTLMTILC